MQEQAASQGFMLNSEVGGGGHSFSSVASLPI